MKKSIPRSEYPRPQFVRESWLNLNGPWTCEIDAGGSGLERHLQNSRGFDTAITVPFCPESVLSGVHRTDFIEHLWYHRKLLVPEEWKNQRILLHFGAVDYECQGFIDGQEVGTHFGGSTSFTWDITDFTAPGREHDFVLRVFDDVRGCIQPAGKQSVRYRSAECSYTRTTGIWQTVWMECVHPCGLERCEITPDLDGGAFVFRPFFLKETRERTLEVTIRMGSKIVGKATVPGTGAVPFSVRLAEVRPWSPEDPFLYDIEYAVRCKGKKIDCAASYGGLRKIHIEGNRIFLNNKRIFLRLVLDQGFYRKGIWTAPSDRDLKRDIELAMAAGFNGARLHQKVFEARYHYWADKLGYLTWGESPSWGVRAFNYGSWTSLRSLQSVLNFMHEWKEIVRQDYSYPSIITWVPCNENWIRESGGFYSKLMTEIYDVTKQLDPTRPCIDASGYHHVKTDLWTVHFYRDSAEALRKDLHPSDSPVPCLNPKLELKAYTGQPFLNDEFGGFSYMPEGVVAKTAGDDWEDYVIYQRMKFRTPQEYVDKIAEQVKVMMKMPGCSGFCFTQLTDIEQEQNGIYTYDRQPKAPVGKLHGAFTGK